MSTIIYLMANESRDCIHAGTTQDLKRALEFYKKLPSIAYPPKKLNMLVYLEVYLDKKEAHQRFEQVVRFNNAEKSALIETVNPDWVEMKPGVNIEV